MEQKQQAHTCLESVRYWSAFFAFGEREEERTFSCEQCDGSSLRASATSTPNAVNVVFRIVGVVIVEDMSDVLDIFNMVSVQQRSRRKMMSMIFVRQNASAKLSA